MAGRQGKYLEGRVYMAWAALALLLASWAGIAMHDRMEQEEAQTPDVREATGDSVASSQSQPHTRTRGS